MTWSRAIPLAWAFAVPPLPPPTQPCATTTPPVPPLAVEETDALGTLITIAFEVALPPEPPEPPRRISHELAPGRLRRLWQSR